MPLQLAQQADAILHHQISRHHRIELLMSSTWRQEVSHVFKLFLCQDMPHLMNTFFVLTVAFFKRYSSVLSLAPILYIHLLLHQ